MKAPPRRGWFDRVLVDLNTQCDLLLPRGALPVANRDEASHNIGRLMTWARTDHLPIISSLETHRTCEPSDGLPPYCLERSPGQRKLPFTVMPSRVVLCGDNTFDVPFDPLHHFQQIIFTKRHRDFLSNPKADRLFNSLRAKALIVFGVVAERCVKVAALGLMARRHRVIVVRDACGQWSSADAELAYRQLAIKGAVLATTDEVLSGTAEVRLEAESHPFVWADDDEYVVVEPIGYVPYRPTNGHGPASRKGRLPHGIFTPPPKKANGNSHSDSLKWSQAHAPLQEVPKRKSVSARRSAKSAN